MDLFEVKEAHESKVDGEAGGVARDHHQVRHVCDEEPALGCSVHTMKIK